MALLLEIIAIPILAGYITYHVVVGLGKRFWK